MNERSKVIEDGPVTPVTGIRRLRLSSDVEEEYEKMRSHALKVYSTCIVISRLELLRLDKKLRRLSIRSGNLGE